MNKILSFCIFLSLIISGCNNESDPEDSKPKIQIEPTWTDRQFLASERTYYIYNKHNGLLLQEIKSDHVKNPELSLDPGEYVLVGIENANQFTMGKENLETISITQPSDGANDIFYTQTDFTIGDADVSIRCTFSRLMGALALIHNSNYNFFVGDNKYYTITWEKQIGSGYHLKNGLINTPTKVTSQRFALERFSMQSFIIFLFPSDPEIPVRFYVTLYNAAGEQTDQWQYTGLVEIAKDMLTTLRLNMSEYIPMTTIPQIKPTTYNCQVQYHYANPWYEIKHKPLFTALKNNYYDFELDELGRINRNQWALQGITDLFLNSFDIEDISEVGLLFPNLTRLGVPNNQIKEVDLSLFPHLEDFDCSKNQIQELDLSPCQNLTYLICENNQISSLNLKHSPKLNTLYCDYNSLTTLDCSLNPNLYNIKCNHTNLENIKFHSNNWINYLKLSHNKLQEIDISTCTKLMELDLSNNQLAMIEIPACQYVQEIKCSNNPLNELKFANVVYKDLRRFTCKGSSNEFPDIPTLLRDNFPDLQWATFPYSVRDGETFVKTYNDKKIPWPYSSWKIEDQNGNEISYEYYNNSKLENKHRLPPISKW